MKNPFSYLKIIISAALLAALIWLMRDKLSAVAAVIIQADKVLILAAIALMLVCLFLQSFRLKFLLDAQAVRLKIKDVVFLTLLGQFFNNFMPTAVGGDVVKAYYASGRAKKKLETFTSVIIDRMLGVITLACVALAALFIRRREDVSKTAIVLIVLIAAIGVIFIAVIFSKKAAKIFLFIGRFVKSAKIKGNIERLYEATNKFRRHKPSLINGLWLSLIAQILIFYMTYLLALSISSKVSFMFLMLTIPAVGMVSMLPSINGLGIRESGFVYFLGPVMGNDKAFALSLLYLAVMLAVSVLGGIVFMFKKEFNHMEVSHD